MPMTTAGRLSTPHFNCLLISVTDIPLLKGSEPSAHIFRTLQQYIRTSGWKYIQSSLCQLWSCAGCQNKLSNVNATFQIQHPPLKPYKNTSATQSHFTKQLSLQKGILVVYAEVNNKNRPNRGHDQCYGELQVKFGQKACFIKAIIYLPDMISGIVLIAAILQNYSSVYKLKNIRNQICMNIRYLLSQILKGIVPSFLNRLLTNLIVAGK